MRAHQEFESYHAPGTLAVAQRASLRKSACAISLRCCIIACQSTKNAMNKILQSLRNVYDAVKDEKIREKALAFEWC
jgi:hypothetical protein